jgi:hypothetical protein
VNTPPWDEEAKDWIPLITVQLTPDQLLCLHSLLGLVHYDEMATAWLAKLPAALQIAVTQ